ncbi:MAG: serine/threonine protein kinase, partial [Polyangiaceae bacterium]|nr:serine/threonine protein kinase [Polyangiaceae bacterium]
MAVQMGEMIPASSSQEPIILDGKYALLSVLGKGAFGTVYEAEHLVVGKKAAIKVLHSELSDDEESRSRFVQ